MEIREDEGFLKADNGIITMSAALDSSLPNLLSLKHQGREYLDLAYPEYQPKSFYNPYPGGLIIALDGISLANLQKEIHTLSPAKVYDQHGNEWQGLGWETAVQNFKPLRGYRYRQYYLTLPGIPLLAITGEIVCGSGLAKYDRLTYTGFYNPGSSMQDCQIRVPIMESRWQSLNAGRESFRIMESYRQVIVKERSASEMLNIVGLNKSDLFIHLDQLVARIRSAHYTAKITGYPQWTSTQYMIFSPKEIVWDSLNGLFDTKFSHEREDL
jgi:hypothetical protein